MSSVTINEELIATLNQLNGVVTLFAPDGQEIGVFVASKRMAQVDRDPGITHEEIQRRLNDPKGKWHSSAEVEAKLRVLRCTPDE